MILCTLLQMMMMMTTTTSSSKSKKERVCVKWKVSCTMVPMFTIYSCVTFSIFSFLILFYLNGPSQIHTYTHSVMIQHCHLHYRLLFHQPCLRKKKSAIFLISLFVSVVLKMLYATLHSHSHAYYAKMIFIFVVKTVYPRTIQHCHPSKMIVPIILPPIHHSFRKYLYFLP